MKKVLFITSVVIINLLLIDVAVLAFNPLGLNLTGITYNNVGNYFSPDPERNILLIFSLISLVTVNRYLIKNRKH